MSEFALIMASIAAVVTAGTPGFLAWLQARKTHVAVNSRLTELLELTRRSSKAEGVLEGKELPRKSEEDP